MVAGNLLALIKAKQTQIAKLRAELEQAQGLLARIVNDTSPASRKRGVHRRGARRRSSKMLEHSPTAHEAAKVLRAAGRPLHATAIATRMNRNGHKVALGTLVSTLSRWVNSRSVFYRVRPNVFGLIAGRHRSGAR
jgi:HB1, ASXL, restriction endonuclease HTH domain